jgi:UDP-N-acetylglucosamine acyltransferase
LPIHETAVIDKKASIGVDCDIGPHAVIQGKVVLGDRNTVGPNAVILGNTAIGSGNTIAGHVHIGGLPQDLAFGGGETYVQIGDNNIIREFTTVHRGTKEGSSTIIGDNNYLMVASHVAHNCILGNNIIMVNSASLGGYVEVNDDAFLGGFVIVHQFCRIGVYSICGVLTKVTKDVPPFMMVEGNPALVRGLNLVGLKRKGFDATRRERIKRAYKVIYRSGFSVSHSLEELEKFDPSNGDIAVIIDFIKSSRRGILLKSPKSANAPPGLQEE